jgi:hypothetical protein
VNSGGSCVSCPGGTYKELSGPSSCRPCPKAPVQFGLRKGTLRLSATPSFKPSNMTVILQMPNGLSDYITFNGRFVNISACVSCFYGPANNPLRYPCTVDATRSNSTQITCLTSTNAQGVNLHVTILVGNSSVVSLDAINYPAAPVVLTVRGCEFTAGPSTSGCPTGGGNKITLVGSSLLVRSLRLRGAIFGFLSVVS